LSARLVGRHFGVVGGDDRAVGQVGAVDGLELADGRGLAVGLVRGFVFEDEQVDEFRRVVLLLPRGVQAGTGLVLGDVADELGDRRLDRVDALGLDRVVGGLVDGHDCFLLDIQQVCLMYSGCGLIRSTE
jgi:hypothetical protein